MNQRLLITIALTIAVCFGFYRGFYEAPVDVNQGEVYRIIFLHVPSAIAAFLAAFILMIFAVAAILKKSEAALRAQVAAVEVGLVFTIVTLATGSIWGRPTWGTWWVWDARLTTTLLLALLNAGYLMLYHSTAPGPGRIKSCSLLGIIIAADIPIIYKSVDWWRTLHQGHSLFERGKDPMDPAIKSVLLYCILSMLIYCCWLIFLRKKNLRLESELTDLTYENLR
jgi:heme exporter protein C